MNKYEHTFLGEGFIGCGQSDVATLLRIDQKSFKFLHTVYGMWNSIMTLVCFLQYGSIIYLEFSDVWESLNSYNSEYKYVRKLIAHANYLLCNFVFPPMTRSFCAFFQHEHLIFFYPHWLLCLAYQLWDFQTICQKTVFF